MQSRPASPASIRPHLEISALALDLFRQSQVIDLHIDSYIWHRVFGYDLNRRHGRGLLGGLVYSQADIPRVTETGINGATWVITTNPARDARDRQEAFRENLAELVGILEVSGSVQVCRTVRDYWDAQRNGRHAATIGIQGGNALERSLGSMHELTRGLILRVTLVHLTSSSIGSTSSPAHVGKDAGLTSFGRQFVEELDALQVFVDLAHISRQGFWDAVDVHDRTKPLLVSHTGVCGVFDHWRNLDDEQLRAVGDSGGIVGIMYHSEFLGDPLFSGKAESIVRHMEHVAKCAGADSVALGSDWDGAICPPADMRTCSELPRLVEIMLRRGWSPENIEKALGQNFLRAWRELRGC